MTPREVYPSEPKSAPMILRCRACKATWSVAQDRAGYERHWLWCKDRPR